MKFCQKITHRRNILSLAFLASLLNAHALNCPNLPSPSALMAKVETAKDAAALAGGPPPATALPS